MLPPRHGRNADGPDVQPARVRRGFRQDKAGFAASKVTVAWARTATGHGRRSIRKGRTGYPEKK